MAQHSPRVARKHGSEEASVPGEVRMTDGVHASVYTVQPSVLKPASDRCIVKAGGRQLPMCDDAVLPSGQVGQPPSHRGSGDFLSHTDRKASHAEARPRRAPTPGRVVSIAA